MLLSDDFISYFGKKFIVIDIKCPQIPFYLLQVSAYIHPSTHLQVPLYCSPLPTLLPPSGRDGVFHLLSLFFLLDSIPSISSELSSLSANRSAYFQLFPSPNTLTLSLHSNLLWRLSPNTNLDPLHPKGSLLRII